MADGNLSALLRIGNEDLSEGSGGGYQHLNPVSGELQAMIPLAGKAEMDRAVDVLKQLPRETVLVDCVGDSEEFGLIVYESALRDGGFA